MQSEVVAGDISRVEPYGLYVVTQRGPALVLIPDISREPIRDLGLRFVVGQRVRIRLVKFVEEHGMYKGSMMDLGEE